MSQSQITEGQISAFAKTLVNNGVIDKSDVEVNKPLIEETLKLSASRDGLAMAVYNYSQPVGSEFTKTAAMSSQFPEQQLTRALHDPQEIFLALYNSKRNEEKAKQDKQNKLLDDALTDWYHYDKSMPADRRYSPNLGGYITKAYFIENPYKCPWQSTGCPLRFKTPEEAQKHRYRHGG